MEKRNNKKAAPKKVTAIKKTAPAPRVFTRAHYTIIKAAMRQIEKTVSEATGQKHKLVSMSLGSDDGDKLCLQDDGTMGPCE